jgi:hypothetical protein
MAVHRLWRRADKAALLLLNLVAVVTLTASWSQVRDQDSLSGQTSWVALAIAGLAIGAAGDAWFVLAAKRTVAERATILLRSTGVVSFPAPVVEPTGAPPGWWRLNWDRLLGIGAGAASAVALSIGWLGLSDVLIDHDQVPWIVGGSFTGLWLLAVAGTAWLAAVLRDQWSALRRINGHLTELGLASVADIPTPLRRIELRGVDGIPSLL